MTQSTRAYREFVERQIQLVDTLSDALRTGQAAIVAFRIADLEESLALQQRLCVELAASADQLHHAGPLAPITGTPSRASQDLQACWQDARRRLAKLNQEYQALLLRSRRTVTAVLNGFRSFEGNYAVEARQQTAGGAVRQEPS